MLIDQINPKIASYFRMREAIGSNSFALCGGRRSGKTYCTMQYLIGKAMQGQIINVASMTAEQGRLGAYADTCTIIRDSALLQSYFDIMTTPREIRSRSDQGKIVFNSYQNPETAKGIACDYLFVNEANNFSKQQYIDLLANVRKGVIIDYNPNCEFWVDDFFADDEICHTTWKDNPYLTNLQLKYFADLKAQAERPDASAIDIRNFNVYYLGKFSELRGSIFMESHFTFLDSEPDDMRHFMIFCDPSALRGADYFACVLSAATRAGKVIILDTYSINDGTRDMIIAKLREWSGRYDDVRIYIEVNGQIGIDFYEYAREDGISVNPFHSKENKFERIVANYQNMRENMEIVRTDHIDEFMAQVYDFDSRCEHDDNIDALNTSYRIQKHFM